ncbi:Endonuclease V [Candidatus Protochlamydia amoebophila]|nr:Endonuclease V [Candidatus Protochlamydia amoebophila]
MLGHYQMSQRFNFDPGFLQPDSIEKATIIQKELANRICLEDEFNTPEFFGGMDVSNNLFDPKQIIYATAILLDSKMLSVQFHNSVSQRQTFPYIPGFLGFREAPALIDALENLPKLPDMIFVDGQGISHPRRLGIASHIGVLVNIPTIGVAKNILFGEPKKDLGSCVGDYVFLYAYGKEIGALVRTKLRCKPLIISTGHRVSLRTAIEYVLNCVKGYRLPEPTRQAHLAANAFRKQNQAGN